MEKKEIEIIEGNKLIALFLKWKKHDKENWWLVPKEYATGLTNNWSDLRFHSSWEWLMPVFIKIGMQWRWSIDKFGCMIFLLDRTIEFGTGHGEDTNSEQRLLHCCWLAVIEFIKHPKVNY